MRTVTLLVSCLAIACTTPTAAPDTGGNPVDAGSDAGSTTPDAGNDAATTPDSGGDSGPMADAGHDAGSTVDANVDSGPMADAGHDAGCSGTLLTVLNADVWCDVSVNGGAASGAASQTVCVPHGTNVALVATAHGGFQLGNWHHTSGDSGSGDPGTVSGGMSTAHVMPGATAATACVWVCCPFTGGSGCPTTEQCP